MNKINILLFSAVILLTLDFIYLNLTKSVFQTQVFKIQHGVMNVKLIPAILCYILLVIGLNYFILQKQGTILEAFLLGFIIYGVFDSTNLAIFKNYEWNVAIMDTVWGGILFALTTWIIYTFNNM
jgi:uncharacterized membrane protein|tara:strand:- start:1104 stop:1478 length:375 start_codon:yes stop_codon:yes gene_type:complete